LWNQIKEIEEARLERLEQRPEKGPQAMVRLLARVIGIGIETADMLVLKSCRGTFAIGEP
jgi:transposase